MCRHCIKYRGRWKPTVSKPRAGVNSPNNSCIWSPSVAGYEDGDRCTHYPSSKVTAVMIDVACDVDISKE